MFVAHSKWFEHLWINDSALNYSFECSPTMCSGLLGKWLCRNLWFHSFRRLYLLRACPTRFSYIDKRVDFHLCRQSACKLARGLVVPTYLIRFIFQRYSAHYIENWKILLPLEKVFSITCKECDGRATFNDNKTNEIPLKYHPTICSIVLKKFKRYQRFPHHNDKLKCNLSQTIKLFA